MVAAAFTCSTVMVPSARSESRSAILAAVSSLIFGSSLKMPPGDLPVTMAQVAKVIRSAASRGGTSVPRASTTACWLRALPATAAGDWAFPATAADDWAEGPAGSDGGGGGGSGAGGGGAGGGGAGGGGASDWSSGCLAASLAASSGGSSPDAIAACSAAICSGVSVFWCSCNSDTVSRFSIAYSMSFSTA